METTADASSAYKKQEGSYTDLYFNYSINQDLRDKRFRTESGYVATFSQELPLVSDNAELSNAFIVTNYKKLSSTSDMVGKVSFFGKTITGLSDDVRISKRLNVPSSRLRGFQRGKVGPVENNDYIGGNYVSSLNFSATLPNLVQGLDNLDIGVFVIPFLSLLLGLFSLSIGIILGILNVFIRDISQLLPIILQLWFWFTPIVYPESIVPEYILKYIKIILILLI